MSATHSAKLTIRVASDAIRDLLIDSAPNLGWNAAVIAIEGTVPVEQFADGPEPAAESK